MEKPLVVITGISGYLGSQVGLHFLRDGSYRVRGTVRSTTNELKIQPLKDAYGDLFNQLQLVEADLLNEETIIAACEGATYIIHTASPFVMNTKPDDEQVLIKPAVEGTLAAMKGAHKHKCKRVVITSTMGAVAYGGVGAEDPNNLRTHFTAADWSKVEGCAPYTKSKTLAEKAAWDFVAALPDAEKFEVCTINPGFIIGPALVKAEFTSGNLIKMVLTKMMPALPNTCFGMVDVRNVAQAHLRAVQVPEAAGQRFININESDFLNRLSKPIKEKYPEFDPTSTLAPKDPNDVWSGVSTTYDNQPSKDILGIQYIDIDQSIIDMVETLLNLGYVERPKKE